MIQEEIQYWLNKKKWTALEASFLLLDLDPRNHNVQIFIEKEAYGDLRGLETFLDSLAVRFRNRLIKHDDLLRNIQQRMKEEAVSNGIDYLGTAPYYIFYGVEIRNPLREKSFSEIEIPIEAFKKYAEEQIFPKDKEYADIPIFGLYHEKNETNLHGSEESTIAPLQKAGNEENQLENEEIIEGVTVGQLKNFLDKSSEEYRPRLDVLIRVLIQLAGKPEGTVPYENTLRTKCEELLKSQGIGSRINESAPVEVAMADIRAIKRILLKSRTTTGGRPPKDQE